MPQPAQDKARNLRLRVVSALILAPAVLVVLYIGFPFVELLVIAIAVGASFEWVKLCFHGRMTPAGYAVVGTATVVAASGGFGAMAYAPWILLAGLLVAGFLGRGSNGTSLPWLEFGLLYISVACLSFLWLRDLPGLGREIVIWLVLIIWATDSGAYAAGRLIGGPKMAPRISPGKTWAGLIGGVISAILVGGLLGLFQDSAGPVMVALLAGVLALVSQGGDLLESLVKRRFDAKDSGTLIPGHGGILDRVDSLLLASIALAAVVWLNGAG